MVRLPFPRQAVHRLLLPFKSLSIGVRGVVLDDRRRLLLVRHTYVEGWYFPGGGVNPAETAHEALTRELAEEVQIRPTAQPALVGVYFNRALARDHVLLYRCADWERIAPFKPSLEIAEADFFDLDRLPPTLSAGTARRIGELFGNAEIETDW